MNINFYFAVYKMYYYIFTLKYILYITVEGVIIQLINSVAINTHSIRQKYNIHRILEYGHIIKLKNTNFLSMNFNFVKGKTNIIDTLSKIQTDVKLEVKFGS